MQSFEEKRKIWENLTLDDYLDNLEYEEANKENECI